MTGKNLKRLRLEMEKEGVDIYVMTLADYHMSEYVGDYSTTSSSRWRATNSL